MSAYRTQLATTAASLGVAFLDLVHLLGPAIGASPSVTVAHGSGDNAPSGLISGGMAFAGIFNGQASYSANISGTWYYLYVNGTAQSSQWVLTTTPPVTGTPAVNGWFFTPNTQGVNALLGFATLTASGTGYTGTIVTSCATIYSYGGNYQYLAWPITYQHHPSDPGSMLMVAAMLQIMLGFLPPVGRYPTFPYGATVGIPANFTGGGPVLTLTGGVTMTDYGNAPQIAMYGANGNNCVLKYNAATAMTTMIANAGGGGYNFAPYGGSFWVTIDNLTSIYCAYPSAYVGIGPAFPSTLTGGPVTALHTYEAFAVSDSNDHFSGALTQQPMYTGSSANTPRHNYSILMPPCPTTLTLSGTGAVTFSINATWSQTGWYDNQPYYTYSTWYIWYSQTAGCWYCSNGGGGALTETPSFYWASPTLVNASWVAERWRDSRKQRLLCAYDDEQRPDDQ